MVGPGWAGLVQVRWFGALVQQLRVGRGEFGESAAEFEPGFEAWLVDQRSFFQLPWWTIILLEFVKAVEKPELAGHQAVENEVKSTVDEGRHVHQLSKRCVTVHEELRPKYEKVKSDDNVHQH